MKKYLTFLRTLWCCSLKLNYIVRYKGLYEGFCVVVLIIIIYLPCEFEREVYGVSHSSCWTKSRLQS